MLCGSYYINLESHFMKMLRYLFDLISTLWAVRFNFARDYTVFFKFNNMCFALNFRKEKTILKIGGAVGAR